MTIFKASPASVYFSHSATHLISRPVFWICLNAYLWCTFKPEERGWGGEWGGYESKIKDKMVWFALQVYYFMAFTYSLPLQFQDFFFYHLPISIWACINMYKSLLRKNRIPRTALESLKGALFALTSSLAPMRLSAYLLGVFSTGLPQQRRRLQALCAPWSPDTPPLGEMSGESEVPGSGLGHGFRARAWQSRMMWGAASLSNKWLNSLVKAQHQLPVCHVDCHRWYFRTVADSHTGLT